MKNRTIIATLLLIAAMFLAPFVLQAKRPVESAPDDDLILRAPAAELAGILTRNGLTEIDCLNTTGSGQKICRVRAPSGSSPKDVISDLIALEPEVAGAEEVYLAALPESYDNITLNQSIVAAQTALSDVSTVNFGTDAAGNNRWVWRGYVNQDAAALVRVSSAQNSYPGTGAVIATIDSGIDPDHPIFDGHTVPGYDFILEQTGDASEWDVLDESTVAILGESTVAILGSEDVVALNESTVAILGGSQSSQLDPVDIPVAFGHGTMVAGIIHLVAPEAKIMPLRVFDGDGKGSIYDVVRAIYFAVDNGATVINMSFSFETFSQELMQAIAYANQSGVVCVASVGNDATEAVVYPAAQSNVVGVAATDVSNYLSPFSNYGNGLVTVAAPGQDVITTYPGGGWASASGTSFAAPWISGGVALLADKLGDGGQGNVDLVETMDALSWAEPTCGSMSDSIGYGRVNLKESLANVIDLNVGGNGGGTASCGGGGNNNCASVGESCVSDNDCCSNSCSGGPPSSRTCNP